jgi:1-deoxy-D-xylulose 5-phosphate reductoisomerase
LKEKISFDTFYKYLLKVLNDRNYRKYAIKEPKNINQIFQVDEWSRNTVYKKINYKNA